MSKIKRSPSRIKRREKQEFLLGPERELIWTDGVVEDLSCGHTVRAKSITGNKRDGNTYLTHHLKIKRRCYECRTEIHPLQVTVRVICCI